MFAAYIIENHYGNFVPHLSSIVEDDNGVEVLVPEASAMACINLIDAQRTLVNNAPPGTAVFPLPIKAPVTVQFVQLSTLKAANARGRLAA